MRVLQLIDSLRPGGAEKMAVNMANALVPQVERSYLCCTRIEGSLKNNLNPGIMYFFLNKKSRFDPVALLKLKQIIKENEINIVHAHGTSFFLPFLLKFGGLKFILIWHIHNGGLTNSTFLTQKFIAFCSRWFNGIFAVNTELKNWAKNKLFCKQVLVCKNFITKNTLVNDSQNRLKGEKESFKIICVANLRPEKGHIYLLEAFEGLKVNKNCSLHLIGAFPKHFESTALYKKFEDSTVKDKIHFYGVKEEITNLLNVADLGVLASDYEGLPLAILEYGSAGLPVVATDVGYCREIIGDNGILIPPKNPSALTKALIYYINNSEIRQKDASGLQKSIRFNFSEQKVIPVVLAFYIKLRKQQKFNY